MSGKKVCEHVKEVPVRGYERRRNGRIERVRGYVRHVREKVSRHKKKIALAGGAVASAAVVYVVVRRRRKQRGSSPSSTELVMRQLKQDTERLRRMSGNKDAVSHFYNRLVSVFREEGKRHGVGEFKHSLKHYKEENKTALILDFDTAKDARTFWEKALMPILKEKEVIAEGSKKTGRWKVGDYVVVGPRISGQNFSNRVYVYFKWK